MTPAPRDPRGNVRRTSSAPPSNRATAQELEARLLTVTAACFFAVGLLTMHLELINVVGLTCAVVSPALAAAAL